MESETVIETGRQFFTWLDEYGALRCWAVYGMVCSVAIPVIFVYCVRLFILKLARPVARIADRLEEPEKTIP